MRSVPEDFTFDVNDDVRIEREKEIIKDIKELDVLLYKRDMVRMIELKDRKINSSRSLLIGIDDIGSNSHGKSTIINNNDDNSANHDMLVSNRTSLVSQLSITSQVAPRYEKKTRYTFTSDSENNNENDIIENIPNDKNTKLRIHTMLTSKKSIWEYRKTKSKLITVYIKILPEGIIRKFDISDEYNIYTLYHIFQSNSKYSFQNHPMIIFPLDTGLYELDPTITLKNENQIANNSGKLFLSRYGVYQNLFNTDENFYRMIGKNDFLVFLYFQQYVPLKAENLIEHYLSTNSGYGSDKDTKNIHKLEVHPIPDNIPPIEKIQSDKLQFYLREIVLRQYKDQQEGSR